MKLPNGVRRLFRLPLSRARMLRDADEELQFHLAMRVAEFRALGMSETEAAMEAQRRFGDADEFRADAVVRADRRSRRFAVLLWLEDFGQDLRIALRQIRRTPGLAIVVVLTLAICIGATTGVYGVVRDLLLAPVPFPDGNRIVTLEARNAGDAEFMWPISAEVYRMWAARSRKLEDFAGYQWGGHALDGVPGTVPDTIGGALVTPSFLSLLRVLPSLGRGFLPSDGRYGAQPVVLLGDSLWRSRFRASPDVIGRSLTVDGVARTIVGVVPNGVGDPNGLGDSGICLPLNIDSMPGVNGFARLRPGVTSAAATQELQAILSTLPDTGWLHGRRASVRTAAERVEPGRRQAVEVLFAAAAALLLIACADVAGLLLMRGWSRRREFAVRQTLGAARGRLARQLLTESLSLAIPGGALGILVAWLGLHAVNAEGFWNFRYIRLDSSALLWTMTVSVTTAVLFGAGPALLVWERSLDSALRAGGARTGQGRATSRAHAVLVIAQIALSLVFLASAGVLTRSFVALVRTPIGFEPDGLFEATVRRNSRPETKFTVAQDIAIMQAVRDAVASTRGISEAAAGALPLTRTISGPNEVESASGVRPSGVIATGGWAVSSDYFRVARISLVRGRGFDASPATATNEVVINERLARRLWPERDALGARMRYGEDANARWLTVVGIAGDVRMPGDVGPDFFGLQVYQSPALMREAEGSVLVRTRVDSTQLRPLLARAIERANVGVRLSEIREGTAALEFAYHAPRFTLLLFGAFTVLAVVLAAVGLFGIIEHAVARRTREIAIRVALGADPAVLTRTILRQSLRLLLIGCAVGLASAYLAGRGLTTLLYGVQPLDPVALGIAMAVLTAIALGASALPVRHALRVDPMETLRSE